MKSKLKEIEPKSKKIAKSVYPCLKIIVNPDKETTVVLFTQKSTGIVVFSDMAKRLIGESSTCWIESNFNRYNGKVILKNK